MKSKKWIKIVLVISSIFMLAACHKKQQQNMNMGSIEDANAAYDGSSRRAYSSGLGQEAAFGDYSQGDHITSKRVYYFDYDSYAVHDSDKPAILANANYLLSHPNAKVMLEGHTDPRGSREYNIGLGERRAKAVAAILTAKGVNPAQIRVVSYGAEKLAAYGHTEADFQKDRRVVLVYLKR